MSWNKEGLYVEGTYLNEHFVQGVVLESRVKYGGKVQHRVSLDFPLMLNGNERDVLLLDDEQLTAVFENEETAA